MHQQSDHDRSGIRRHALLRGMASPPARSVAYRLSLSSQLITSPTGSWAQRVSECSTSRWHSGQRHLLEGLRALPIITAEALTPQGQASPPEPGHETPGR